MKVMCGAAADTRGSGIGDAGRRRALRALGVVAGSIWVPSYAAQQAGAAAPGLLSDLPALVAMLRAGERVLYFRHPPTTWSGVDRADWPRERQRQLSAEGIAQARAIGEAFRRHRLKAAEIYASPMVRCSDTAEIAFGRVEERPELLGLLTLSTGRDERIAYSRRLLGRPVPPGELRILVGHSSTIRESSGASLGEGDAALVRPDQASSGFLLEGTVRADAWKTLSNMASS